jgi:hypothetical protein
VNEARNADNIRAETVPALLRVAAVQLARLSAEDRAAVRPYVEQLLKQHTLRSG